MLSTVPENPGPLATGFFFYWLSPTECQRLKSAPFDVALLRDVDKSPATKSQTLIPLFFSENPIGVSCELNLFGD